MTIGQRIKQKRNEKGLSLFELAKLVDLTDSAIFRYENGSVKNPPYEKLSALANALDTTPEYLAFGLDTPLVNDDPELTEYLEELKSRPEQRMMFSLTKNATKKDVEQAVAIVEAFLKSKGNTNE